jgi:RNA polymerase sigma-70 factor (ECF subfamily)
VWYEDGERPEMTGKPSLADGLAVAPTAAAELEAFALAHYSRLIRLAGIVTRNADAAQDAVQTALERAWRHRRDLDDPSRLRSWLDRIVVREAIREARRRRGFLARVFGASSVEWLDVTEHAAAHVDTAIEATDQALLREVLATLSPGHRAVIALHLQVGYTVEETAGLLGIPVDTVRSRLRAARRRLRDQMTEMIT